MGKHIEDCYGEEHFCVIPHKVLGDIILVESTHLKTFELDSGLRIIPLLSLNSYGDFEKVNGATLRQFTMLG